jgi:hypothetical protein
MFSSAARKTRYLITVISAIATVWTIQGCLLAAPPKIEFYDGHIYTQLDGEYSKNPQKKNWGDQLYQQIEFGFKVDFSTHILGYGFLTTKWHAFHWNREERYVQLRTLGVSYLFDPRTKLSIGNYYIDLSPYVFQGVGWKPNIINGLEFKVDKENMFLQSFVGNNAENPEEEEGENVDVNYSTIDRGWVGGVRKERPTIWFGTKVKHNFVRKTDLIGYITGIYLHENYSKENESDGWLELYNNNILEGDLDFRFFDYVDIELAQCFMQYDKHEYTLHPDYYGTDKDFYEKKDHSRYNAGAYKYKVEVDDMLGTYLGKYDTSIWIEYENIDEKFMPVYMDTWLNTRVLDTRYVKVNGRRGWYGNIKQYVGFGSSIGYGQRRNKLSDGLNLNEQEFIYEFKLSQKFRLQYIYFLKNVENGFFPDGGNKLDGFYIKFGSDPIDCLYFELEYMKNAENYENYDRLLLKSIIWGF